VLRKNRQSLERSKYSGQAKPQTQEVVGVNQAEVVQGQSLECQAQKLELDP
jgi:hypothetical protein